MFRRVLQLPEHRSVLLLGPRQTGKSTLVRAALPRKSWTIDLLRHDESLAYTKDPGLFRREAEAAIARGETTIFIDEVQKVPALLDEVHSLIESSPGKTSRARFILTGSSARKLRRGGANLLAGRASVRHLHPLTMGEMGDAFELERVLRYGSLPAVVTSNDADAVEFLRSYAETYLREEVFAEALVRNLGGFARFVDVAAAQSGDVLNCAGVGRDAGVASRTVQQYYGILEDTLLGFRLDAFRKSPRAQLVLHPKFHLFDTGVTNALTGRLDAKPDPVRRGRLFEQWVVTECIRLADYLHPETRLHFWRTNNGAEVDLVFERHGEIRAAVEIKARGEIGGHDLSGLRSFGEAHPGVPLVVVCTAKNPSKLKGVEVLPFRRFFEEFARWA